VPCSGPNFRAVCTAHLEVHPSNHCKIEKQFPLSKTAEASLSISPTLLRTSSSKLEASRFESPDEPPRHTGWTPAQSRECLLSQQAFSIEFVGLKSVSDRSLGTPFIIRAAALWVPTSQRDVSLYVWQLGKLSPPTTTCHIRRQLVAGTIRESRRQIRAPERGVASANRLVGLKPTELSRSIPGTKRNGSRR
jgi:hypothetical protein